MAGKRFTKRFTLCGDDGSKQRIEIQVAGGWATMSVLGKNGKTRSEVALDCFGGATNCRVWPNYKILESDPLLSYVMEGNPTK